MVGKAGRSAIDHIDIMHRAAADAIALVGNMDQVSFSESRVTLAAVSFCHFMVGQAACDLMDHYPEFVTDHPQLPWTFLRARRDRILDDGYAIPAEDIWTVTQQTIRPLIAELDALRNWHAQGE